MRPVLDGIDFRKIGDERAAELSKEFTLEELEDAILSCHGDKAPGPDGFNFKFVKSFWGTLKSDFLGLVEEFHANGRLPKGISSYFLALVPKYSNPQDLIEFRPISLLGSIYKILAKILAARLKMVLKPVISPNQSAFLPERNILDGVVIINEVVDFVNKTKKKCLILKVDFEKAYDSVNWSFLEYMMRRMGMDEKWRKWIKECVFKGDLSVLVNGSPTKEFTIQKGLKQGDPLAPFLFLMVAEGLTGMVNKAEEKGVYKGFKVGKHEEKVSILQYADDTLLVGEATWENLWTMKALLRCFELVSGLKVNFHKSRVIGINLEEHFLNDAAVFLNCKQGSIPFKYLGIPIGANPRKENTWRPVIDLLNKRLSSWRKKHLSIGGRLTLINSVLNSLPIYFMSFYKAPKKVINKIVSIQRNFLWGGSLGVRKIAWVKWERVCLSKKEGGLGVKNLEWFNKALLGKWRWRLLKGEESLWVRIVKSRYGVIDASSTMVDPVGNRASSWWKTICQCGGSINSEDWFKECLHRRLGRGDRTLFWEDSWWGGGALKDLYPRLFSLSEQKEKAIADCGSWCERGWEWSLVWRREMFVWEKEVLQEFLQFIQPAILIKERNDEWSWGMDHSGSFTTKSAYLFLEKQAILVQNRHASAAGIFKLLWKGKIPTKVLTFSWQLLLERVPTKMNLISRGVSLAAEQQSVFSAM